MPGENEDFDFESAVDEIGSGLGFDSDDGPEKDDDVVLDVQAKEVAEPLVLTDQSQATPAADPAVDPAAAPAPAVAADPTAEAPKTWRKEASAVWAALPPEARAEVIKREEDMFRGLEAYKADAGLGKTFKTVLEPYREVMERYRVDPVQQVTGLMKSHYTLAFGTPDEKVNLLRTIARDYQIDLGAVGEAPYVDPAVQSLQSELQTLKSAQARREEAERAQVTQAKTREVESFAADPANVHFNDVGHEMVRLIEAKVCETLPEAYERAVWSNPVTRAKEMARQQAEATQKARDAAAAKVADAAKAKAANVRSSAKNGSAAAPLGSMDDTIAQTLAAIKSRG